MGDDARLRRHRGDWEALANLDPLWAILSDPSRKFGRWDLDEFLKSGEQEIDSALATLDTLGLPVQHRVAVDVGCGVGRLTRALARRFSRVIGVDISEGMVMRARTLNAPIPNCEFEISADPDLSAFQENSVDLVYSTLVLQHLPDHTLIERYIASFIRILSPGGVAVFQLPTGMPVRRRLQPRRRIYAALRLVGVPDDYLYRRLKLTPIRMNWLRHDRVVSLVHAAGGQVVSATADTRAGGGIPSRTYTVTKSS